MMEFPTSTPVPTKLAVLFCTSSTITLSFGPIKKRRKCTSSAVIASRGAALVKPFTAEV
jgi:hypothetical protein